MKTENQRKSEDEFVEIEVDEINLSWIFFVGFLLINLVALVIIGIRIIFNF